MQDSAGSGPVVDVWANFWPPALFEAYPPLAALYRRLGMEARMTLDADALAAEARSAGVSRVILSATAFPGSPSTNDAVLEAAARHPGLILPCASVDPREGMAAVRALRRAVGQGAAALKLLPFLYGLAPDHAACFPLYAACVDLGVPVLILTGHTAVALPNETGRPGALDAVALHFPELTIVAGHGGYPWTAELTALAWKHPNLYIDTSGHRPKYLPAELLAFLDRQGRGKVMFGTGHPMMDYAGPLAEAAALPIREESRALFLGGAAARVWPQLAEAA
jgi:hypothetical protein